MTPQERALVQELFDRLAAAEGAPRDPEAERAIADGLRRAPNAVYALVQTALVQDEALRAADARIREFEAAFDQNAPAEQRGFLDTMRDSLFGPRDEPRGSVPSVGERGGQTPWAPMQREAGQWGRTEGGPFAGAPGPGYPAQQEASRGGSFLGTAAATVAGVVGGALLLNTIRSAFGSHSQGPFQGSLEGGGRDGGGRDGGGPWSGGSGGGDLARDAGLNDIGSGGRSRFGDTEGGRAASAFDSRAGAQEKSTGDSEDSDDGYDDGYDGDFDSSDDGSDRDDI